MICFNFEMKAFLHSVLFSLSMMCLLRGVVDAFRPAKLLYKQLVKDYNRRIRPVNQNSHQLTVHLGLKLSQLIDVDEKNQVLTTNVWVEQMWEDVNLVWKPENYSGVQMLYIPSDEIWLPDIVLYNNADGKYELTIMTKATVYYNGTVRWIPPAIYKSSCTIKVEFFPFDEQECEMMFGSWTYNGNQVNLKHIMQQENPNLKGKVAINLAVDISEFYESVEWDILNLTAIRRDKKYPCCTENFPEVTFSFNLRRKTLFYTVNLIMPCVAISFLTVLVFYLPSESGEKVSLSISILLSLTVFFLLLTEIIPPTSLVVPLIGKYLIFTMILVTLSIIVTVVVLNVHFRRPNTHKMTPWIRKIFINVLPRLLLMRRPSEYGESHQSCTFNKWSCESQLPEEKSHHELQSMLYQPLAPLLDVKQAADHQPHSTNSKIKEKIKQAIESVRFIAERIKTEDQRSSVREDWKFVAMVLDRLFLWIFSTACVIGSLGIVLQAPTLYDTREPLNKQNISYAPNLSLMTELMDIS